MFLQQFNNNKITDKLFRYSFIVKGLTRDHYSDSDNRYHKPFDLKERANILIKKNIDN